MPGIKEIRLWWHGIAALPETPTSQAYYALRRLWGDHTIAGTRGFYRVGSEDHVTPALFQIWAAIPNFDWVQPLVQFIGGNAGSAESAQWAYACEETLDAKLRPFHKKNFVIPDIMLRFTDEDGSGLIAFEVKKPGVAVEAKDGRKLETYCDLPSTRAMERRFGCFLVSDMQRESCMEVTGDRWPILTWETLAAQQIAAARALPFEAEICDRLSDWIAHHFMRYGIGPNSSSGAPPSMGPSYGSTESYERIDALPIPESCRIFLKGSECVEAAMRGYSPAPPLPWLSGEPEASGIRKARQQTTADRLLCRWSTDWSAAKEGVWKL